MDEIYKIAAGYYNSLESYSAYGGVKNKYNWFFQIIMCSAVYLVANFTLIQRWYITELHGYVFLGLVMLIEFMALMSLLQAQEYRNQCVSTKIEEDYGVRVSSIHEAKIILLKQYISNEQNEFGAIAKEIQEMLKISETHIQNKHWVDTVSFYIFNEDSKTRILTLFVLMCSILTVLTVGAEADITTLRDSLASLKSEELYKAFGLAFIFALMIWLGLLVLTKMLRRITIYLSLFFSNRETRNIEMIKFLLADLVKYHTFEKTNDEMPKIIIKV